MMPRGGSEIVEYMLLQPYFRGDRLEAAGHMLSARHRGSSRLPVVGLSTLH